MRNALVVCSDTVGTEILQYLLGSGNSIDTVVVTRKTDLIEEMAAQSGVECLLQYEDRNALAGLKGRRYRWLLNLWGTVVLDMDVLGLAERSVNVHPGLVPANRGTDCATWSIRYGIPAGVTLMEMTPELDAGPVYVQQELPFQLPVTGAELAGHLKRACVELFIREWPAIRDGITRPVPQSGPARCFRRADTLKDRERDLNADEQTRDVVAWMLAHDFSPHSRARVRLGDRLYEVNVTVDEIEEDI